MSGEDTEIQRAIINTQSALDNFDKQLYELIEKEQFLNDLIKKSRSVSCTKTHCIPTNKNVLNALELHYGQAMHLTLLRGDGVKLPLVVPINARVLELQWAVQEAITNYLTEHESMSSNSDHTPNSNPSNCEQLVPEHCLPSLPKSISWRHIWKTKCLAIVNPQSRLPPIGNPSIITRLDAAENRLQESYNLRNGTLITFVRRLKRK